MDICLFQFLRFRFFNDVIRFVSRYLYVIPPVGLNPKSQFAVANNWLSFFIHRFIKSICGMVPSLNPPERKLYC